jgi:3-methylfumaryl-CoA hydratase
MDPSNWLGRQESHDDWVTPSRVAAWHATLDHDAPVPHEGDEVPPAFYWALFPPITHTAGLSPDGHPRRGGFLPPVDLPRRMWAGSRLTMHAPLRAGAHVRRQSTIEGLEEKQGKSGPLVFVTVHHAVSAGAELILEDVEELVYRGAAGGLSASTGAPADDAAWQRVMHPSEVLLFRYSALMFNGHRIHYDRAYAESEGYPNVVVHGPLIATLLLDLLSANTNNAPVERFQFRAMRPAFANEALTLRGAPNAGGKHVRLWSDGVEAEAWIR